MKNNIALIMLSALCIFLVLNMFGKWIDPNPEKEAQKELQNYFEKGNLSAQTKTENVKIDSGRTASVKPLQPSSNINLALAIETVNKALPQVKQAVNSANPKITEFSKVEAVAKGEIPFADIKISENKTVRVQYIGKYLTFNTEVDEKGVPTKNATYTYKGGFTRAVAEVPKAAFFNDKYETKEVWIPEDSAFVIQNIENFTLKNEPVQTGWQISLKSNLQFGLKNDSYNGLMNQILFKINPDGFVSWNFGGGYFVPFKGNPFPMITGGAEANLVKFPKRKR